ncbi:unnamed protein product [Soboliphyme baturini]|uniref:Transcriptional regulator n=1 Tax=Soboliphyme baturini TaxID=241478 RepID=A0A183J1M0_9BILA|nr:unnamed protein product [Soboliphyme baturini]
MPNGETVRTTQIEHLDDEQRRRLLNGINDVLSGRFVPPEPTDRKYPISASCLPSMIPCQTITPYSYTTSYITGVRQLDIELREYFTFFRER